MNARYVSVFHVHVPAHTRQLYEANSLGTCEATTMRMLSLLQVNVKADIINIHEDEAAAFHGFAMPSPSFAAALAFVAGVLLQD